MPTKKPTPEQRADYNAKQRAMRARDRDKYNAEQRARHARDRDKYNAQQRDRRNARDPEERAERTRLERHRRAALLTPWGRAERKARQYARRRDRNYGLAEGQAPRTLESQHGGCAICETPIFLVSAVRLLRGQRTTAAVDHDHALARLHGHSVEKGCLHCVRGLLCNSCNQQHYGEDPEILDRAAAYFRYWAGIDCPERELVAA